MQSWVQAYKKKGVRPTPSTEQLADPPGCGDSVELDLLLIHSYTHGRSWMRACSVSPGPDRSACWGLAREVSPGSKYDILFQSFILMSVVDAQIWM